jgi:succinyl-diaminopimelate desuccinylase
VNLASEKLSKQKIIKYVDENSASIIKFLQELVSIPSDNPPGDCMELSKCIGQNLKELRFKDVSLIEVDKEEVEKMGRKQVANILTYETYSNDGPEITLNSHGDVVPPGQGWSQEPYGGNIVDGKLYGRGAAVSKSDIASYTFAVLALRNVAEQLQGKISLAFTFDEETGGKIGPQWLLKNGIIDPDIAICPGFTYSIGNASNGCLHVEVKVKGKSAHAAEPQYGFDAIEAMTKVLDSLYEYRKTLKNISSNIPGIESPTLVVGLIEGGINTNVVPDECTIRIDRRLIPEENAEKAERDIYEIVNRAIQESDGVSFEFNRILLANSFGPTPEDSLLIKSLSENWNEIMEGELTITGSPLYTDARLFAEANVPVVMFGAGPRTLAEANGHKADENVKVEDLINATKIVALTLFDLLRKE